MRHVGDREILVSCLILATETAGARLQIQITVMNSGAMTGSATDERNDKYTPR